LQLENKPLKQVFTLPNSKRTTKSKNLVLRENANKIFIIESYFRNGHTVRESGSVQRKPGSSRPKVRTEENIETVQRQMEEEPRSSLRQLWQQTELTMSTCQKIVQKNLDDSVTAERYRNNILDVFVNQLQLAQGYFQYDGAMTLYTLFEDRLINLDFRPALTPLDYYLFPHLKNTIFKEPVRTIDDLKSRIKEQCERVTDIGTCF
jgi:hypothetical protein